METVTLITIQVSTNVSNLPHFVGFTNTVSIYQHEEIETLVEDESGNVTNLGSYRVLNSHIRLNPRSLTPLLLSQELRHDQELPHGRMLGERIARDVKDKFTNDNSLQEPVFISVNVKFIKERRFIMPRVIVSTPLFSRGASEEVLQRLVEEQRVESTYLEEGDETCSICMEKLSENIIIRMPRCLHMFHQDCLFEWLGRQNSCPMCRGVPYELEQRLKSLA